MEGKSYRICFANVHNISTCTSIEIDNRCSVLRNMYNNYYVLFFTKIISNESWVLCMSSPNWKFSNVYLKTVFCTIMMNFK